MDLVRYMNGTGQLRFLDIDDIRSATYDKSVSTLLYSLRGDCIFNLKEPEYFRCIIGTNADRIAKILVLKSRILPDANKNP